MDIERGIYLMNVFGGSCTKYHEVTCRPNEVVWFCFLAFETALGHSYGRFYPLLTYAHPFTELYTRSRTMATLIRAVRAHSRLADSLRS